MPLLSVFECNNCKRIFHGPAFKEHYVGKLLNIYSLSGVTLCKSCVIDLIHESHDERVQNLTYHTLVTQPTQAHRKV